MPSLSREGLDVGEGSDSRGVSWSTGLGFYAALTALMPPPRVEAAVMQLRLYVQSRRGHAHVGPHLGKSQGLLLACLFTVPIEQVPLWLADASGFQDRCSCFHPFCPLSPVPEFWLMCRDLLAYRLERGICCS